MGGFAALSPARSKVATCIAPLLGIFDLNVGSQFLAEWLPTVSGHKGRPR